MNIEFMDSMYPSRMANPTTKEVAKTYMAPNVMRSVLSPTPLNKKYEITVGTAAHVIPPASRRNQLAKL